MGKLDKDLIQNIAKEIAKKLPDWEYDTIFAESHWQSGIKNRQKKILFLNEKGTKINIIPGYSRKDRQPNTYINTPTVGVDGTRGTDAIYKRLEKLLPDAEKYWDECFSSEKDDNSLYNILVSRLNELIKVGKINNGEPQKITLDSTQDENSLRRSLRGKVNFYAKNNYGDLEVAPSYVNVTLTLRDFEAIQKIVKILSEL